MFFQNLVCVCVCVCWSVHDLPLFICSRKTLFEMAEKDTKQGRAGKAGPRMWLAGERRWPMALPDRLDSVTE